MGERYRPWSAPGSIYSGRSRSPIAMGFWDCTRIVWRLRIVIGYWCFLWSPGNPATMALFVWESKGLRMYWVAGIAWLASEFQDFQGLLRYWNPTYSLFCSDCGRISILVRSWIVTESWRNSSTSVPTWSSSSIYSGTIVEQLQWDCGGIQDCRRIGLIALGFCMTAQSFSSSIIPPPIVLTGLQRIV